MALRTHCTSACRSGKVVPNPVMGSTVSTMERLVAPPTPVCTLCRSNSHWSEQHRCSNCHAVGDHGWADCPARQEGLHWCVTCNSLATHPPNACPPCSICTFRGCSHQDVDAAHPTCGECLPDACLRRLHTSIDHLKHVLEPRWSVRQKYSTCLACQCTVYGTRTCPACDKLVALLEKCSTCGAQFPNMCVGYCPNCGVATGHDKSANDVPTMC
jgi:hypothetical protein